MEIKTNKNIPEKKDKDDSFLFSTSLIFDENIDKLWLYLRDISQEVSNIDFLDDFKYIKGDNTWTIGNICSMYWVGVTHITIKCKSIKVDRTRKKIRWKFKCDIGINYYKTLILYRITQNGKTLVKSCFTRTKKKNKLIDFSNTLNYYLKLQYNILLQQSKYLQSIKNDIISYESCIINKDHLKIWKLITDIKKLYEFNSDTIIFFESKGSINEIGSFIKYFNKNLKKFVFLKVIEYDNSEQKNCWTFCLEAIGTELVNVAKSIEFKIYKINNNKNQLSILHKFSYNSNPDYINQFNIKKKETFKKIIQYLEENSQNNESS